MRGNRLARQSAVRRLWSIPAYAGEPGDDGGYHRCGEVYPRVCGGTERAGARRIIDRGLSPRMRGNPSRAAGSPVMLRSIPAYAGEPLLLFGIVDDGVVYPRVCGGTTTTVRAPTAADGLSPRMRGNRLAARISVCRGRSIPAYAGEPHAGTQYNRAHWVYPRVCGGTKMVVSATPQPGGLSPRMRGNQICSDADCWCARSIPAYAGEPADGAGAPFGE